MAASVSPLEDDQTTDRLNIETAGRRRSSLDVEKSSIWAEVFRSKGILGDQANEHIGLSSPSSRTSTASI